MPFVRRKRAVTKLFVRRKRAVTKPGMKGREQ
jgi:hypothetical protein